MKKYLSITLFVLFAFVLSVFSPYTAHASDDPLANPSEVALEYMAVRKEMLATGNTAALSAIAISGIVTDEVKHREYLAENNITLPDVTYTVDTVETLDGGAIVTLREVGVNNPLEVSHTLLITTNENDLPIVVSDEYIENHTGFASCSYVVPDTSAQSRAVALTSTNCFTYIANNEVGYLEKASNSQLDSKTANAGNANYTKYGAWYGSNPAAWCAMFVSWCADQANVRTSIIPKESYVPTVADFYEDKGQFYPSASRGGTYTPKAGDIVFLYWDGRLGHMGLVYSVSGSNITIIHGNWGGAVVKETYALTNTFLTDYGSTDFAFSDHHWTGSSFSEYCRNCGAPRNYLS